MKENKKENKKLIFVMYAAIDHHLQFSIKRKICVSFLLSDIILLKTY